MTTYNFNPGPSPLPQEVLDHAQANMFNFEQSGMGIMELSHRSPQYEGVHNQTIKQIRKLLDVPEDYSVLLLQGGASLQFAMSAMNFLPADQKAAFVMTGSWSEKAKKEASFYGQTYELATSKANQYKNIPEVDLSLVSPDTAYIHYTSNNTIFGTQWTRFPNSDQPAIVDMSSDILSKEVDWNTVDMAYAGAQKNAGMSGVTIVIVRNSLLDHASENVSPTLSYKQHDKANSLYNTPPTSAIYMTGLVCDWIEKNGGLKGMKQRAEEKAQLIYDEIDGSEGFYTGHADTASRSNMNVTFNLPSEELEKSFLAKAKAEGFVGLNGHRSVGGCRASIYNAVPKEHVEKLISFMKEFRSVNK
ncbi:3-phosphoserine/phosphohydroxythreonine transaminase [Salisediminibacterium beveridgei]|uniref:Phosphoserine aminotransferase n=1 Tax=Salisediminibacterium beveridgei TaxID=632773 RepID=A0A1D7QTY9_9BACI|nr:3-phosphoserine/phosphohydroxythreonine transaminase [Salisediminibacterium beveridgei]AOM82459.1 Phosphoserine aminotransferase [Salisediminibacterium beveridgei]